ncbi:unnamed protein product [Musa banksii]
MSRGARPGPAIMPREQDGRQRSSSAYYVASASPQRPFSALPHSRPRLPVTRAAILGFLYRFQRGEPTRPSGFHRSFLVVTISPPLSRIHVGGFTFFGFSAERCTRLSRRWWRWFGGRTQTQAPGAWLIAVIMMGICIERILWSPKVGLGISLWWTICR